MVIPPSASARSLPDIDGAGAGEGKEEIILHRRGATQMTKAEASQIMKSDAQDEHGKPVNKREDRVDRLVHDLSARHFVAWLVEYKGLNESVSENVESNLDDLLRAHRLRGRLDRGGLWAVIISYLEWRTSHSRK